jgi:hypothetical protein
MAVIVLEEKILDYPGMEVHPDFNDGWLVIVKKEHITKDGRHMDEPIGRIYVANQKLVEVYSDGYERQSKE